MKKRVIKSISVSDDTWREFQEYAKKLEVSVSSLLEKYMLQELKKLSR